MRALLVAILALVLVTTGSAAGQQTPSSSYGEAVFVVSGRGYGHGVGMSQYGAYGQALAGRTYQQILAHYYTGTQIGRAGRKELRVLLAEGRRAVTVSSAVPFTALDASGLSYKLPKGSLTLRADLTLPSDTGPVAAIQPLVLRPGKKAPLALDGKLYRGKLELVPQGGFLRVVNVLPLESYLDGVVAGEVPHSWPAEALKAQAVAARSYALASALKGGRSTSTPTRAARCTSGSRARSRRRRRRSTTRPVKSCSTPGRSRRPTTSRRRGARRRAQRTSSGSPCRISCRGRIRGTSSRPTIAGAPFSWGRGRCSRSSRRRGGCSTLEASRLPRDASGP